jgi:hypothetical protein
MLLQAALHHVRGLLEEYMLFRRLPAAKRQVPVQSGHWLDYDPLGVGYAGFGHRRGGDHRVRDLAAEPQQAVLG